MTLGGSRGLLRVSKNLPCELQAAMAVERVSEPDFYRRVTGDDYPGEYGERNAARRRGAKFEANLYMNDAALLREAVAPIFGYDPDDITTRNFADELPGVGHTLQAQRLHRTRTVLRSAVRGHDVPDLLIQPQLSVAVGAGQPVYITPDIMVFDRDRRVFVPGELKSFIVRATGIDSGDLDLTRRQAAVEIVALQNEMTQAGGAVDVESGAVFVFSTPYGLRPAPAHVESLDAAIHEVTRAIAAMEQVRTRLALLRQGDQAPLEMLVDELDVNYRDACIGSCIMTDRCKLLAGNSAALLGDSAHELLGEDADLARVADLIEGAAPATPEEEALAPILRDAAQAMRLTA